MAIKRTENQPTGNGKVRVTDAAGASRLLQEGRTKMKDPREAAIAAAIRKDAQEAAAVEAMRAGKLGSRRSAEVDAPDSPTPPPTDRAVEVDLPITPEEGWDAVEVSTSSGTTPRTPADPRAIGFREFIDQKARVTLELKDGTFSVPIITYKVTTMAVFLFLPLADDTIGFVPKTGSHIRAGIGERVFEVVYLGAYIEMESMNFAIMTLYREDTQAMAEEAAAARQTSSAYEDSDVVRSLRT